MPRSGWEKPVSDRRLSDVVSVGVLTRVFPPGLVDEVIAEALRDIRPMIPGSTPTERRRSATCEPSPLAAIPFS